MNPPGGRPTKLTPEVEAVFVDTLRKGLPWRLACWKVGISEQTLYNWRNKGKTDLANEESTDAARFFEACTRAATEWAERQWAEATDAPDGKTAQPHQWGLCVRFPWLNPKSGIEISGPDGGPMLTGQVSAEDAAKALAALLEKRDEPA